MDDREPDGRGGDNRGDEPGGVCRGLHRRDDQGAQEVQVADRGPLQEDECDLREVSLDGGGRQLQVGETGGCQVDSARCSVWAA